MLAELVVEIRHGGRHRRFLPCHGIPLTHHGGPLSLHHIALSLDGLPFPPGAIAFACVLGQVGFKNQDFVGLRFHRGLQLLDLGRLLLVDPNQALQPPPQLLQLQHVALRLLTALLDHGFQRIRPGNLSRFFLLNRMQLLVRQPPSLQKLLRVASGLRHALAITSIRLSTRQLSNQFQIEIRLQQIGLGLQQRLCQERGEGFRVRKGTIHMQGRGVEQPLADGFRRQGFQAPSRNQGVAAAKRLNTFVLLGKLLWRWRIQQRFETSRQKHIRRRVQHQGIAWQGFGLLGATQQARSLQVRFQGCGHWPRRIPAGHWQQWNVYQLYGMVKGAH